jgi:glutathione-specific gamma-glutamylcyclotransferase
MRINSSPDLWVFGYGSLMWNPGFAFVERRKATLEGFTRRLCIWSHIYRGTPEAPGLVFGLAPGGACHGVAFRVEESLRDETIGYLRERELITYVYREIEAPALLDDGRRVDVLTYVADHDNPQFAGALPQDEALAVIRRSRGKGGANVDYVLNTRAELSRLGIEDAELDAICERLVA